jgi:hypothetical protein
MTTRGVEFLENWIQKNVTSADKNGSRERATELAKRCVAEAAVFEISLDDLEPKWGSIETIIYEAMLHLEEPGTSGN